MKVLLKVAAIAALLLLAVIPASSERVSVSHSMPSLARRAERIAIVEVIAIAPEGHAMVAQARVRETWKGSPGKELFFYASPSWPCDTSRAEVGWTLLLFLVRRPNYPSAFSIMSSGDGEFQIVKDDKDEFVVTGDMGPVETPTTEIVRPDGTKMEVIPVGTLREYVHDFLGSLDNK
jgi:hypothetical protein